MVHHLLKIAEGETEEDALKRWWNENGLDHDMARINRKAEYARQKLKSGNIDDLVKAAIRMSPYGKENAT